MPERIAVSILIPTYKRSGDYLRESIQSAIDQQFPFDAFEIIVISDGDPEAKNVLPDLVYGHKNKKPILHYIELEKNSGQSAALNYGLRKAKGEFLVVHHDDDRLLPNKLTDLFPVIRFDETAGMVSAVSETIGPAGEIIEPLNSKRQAGMRRDKSGGGGFVKQRYHSCARGETVMYRTMAIKQAGGWDESLPHGEECDMHLSISKNWYIRWADKVVSQYRIHESNKSLKPDGGMRPGVHDYGRRARETYRDPIMVTVCSLPERVRGLLKVVNDLLPQCDILNVFLAGYDVLPDAEALQSPKINLVHCSKDQDRGTREKFSFLEGFNGYYITCDDDIHYPPNYVEELVRGIERHRRAALVSFHGSIIKNHPVKNFFKERTCFHFRRDLPEDCEVDVTSNVTAGFHTDTLELTDKDFECERKIDDILVSMAAIRQDVDRIVLKHPGEWIMPNPDVEHLGGLYDIYSKGDGDPVIAEKVNSITWPPVERKMQEVTTWIVNPGKDSLKFTGIAGDHQTELIRKTHTFYEIDLLLALQKHIDGRAGIAIDVGANFGNHTLFFNQVCGREVLSIEPGDVSFDLLNKNRYSNKGPEIDARKYAAADKSGLGFMVPEKPGNVGASQVFFNPKGDCRQVKTFTLDQLLKESRFCNGEPVAVLKIDVEGSEPLVLKGATHILKKHRPVIACEASTENELKNVFDILQPLGYKIEKRYCATATYIFLPEEM